MLTACWSSHISICGVLHNRDDLAAEKSNVAAEKKRRIHAEAIINRAKGGGIRPGDFPNVRDVDRHVEELAHEAILWSEKACAIGGSHSALPATIESIFENTFKVCREEVKRRLDEKQNNLSAFLGNDEPVVLSGGDSMNLDTQYVLYECLCKNYQKIVPVELDNMEWLASEVQRGCTMPADASLVRGVMSGDAWPFFDALMKNYIMVFVEVSACLVVDESTLLSYRICTERRHYSRTVERGSIALTRYLSAGGVSQAILTVRVYSSFRRVVCTHPVHPSHAPRSIKLAKTLSLRRPR